MHDSSLLLGILTALGGNVRTPALSPTTVKAGKGKYCPCLLNFLRLIIQWFPCKFELPLQPKQPTNFDRDLYMRFLVETPIERLSIKRSCISQTSHLRRFAQFLKYVD
jgi:hypothetical protein